MSFSRESFLSPRKLEAPESTANGIVLLNSPMKALHAVELTANAIRNAGIANLNLVHDATSAQSVLMEVPGEARNGGESSVGSALACWYIARAAVGTYDELPSSMEDWLPDEINEQVAVFQEAPDVFNAFAKVLNNQFMEEREMSIEDKQNDYQDLLKMLYDRRSNMTTYLKLEQCPAIADFLFDVHQDPLFEDATTLLLASDSEGAKKRLGELIRGQLDQLRKPDHPTELPEKIDLLYLDPMLTVIEPISGIINPGTEDLAVEIYTQYFDLGRGELEGNLPRDRELHKFVRGTRRRMLEVFSHSENHKLWTIYSNFFGEHAKHHEARLLLISVMQDLERNTYFEKLTKLSPLIELCFGDDNGVTQPLLDSLYGKEASPVTNRVLHDMIAVSFAHYNDNPSGKGETDQAKFNRTMWVEQMVEGLNLYRPTHENEKDFLRRLIRNQSAPTQAVQKAKEILGVFSIENPS